jgi:hypothetical protein
MISLVVLFSAYCTYTKTNGDSIELFNLRERYIKISGRQIFLIPRKSLCFDTALKIFMGYTLGTVDSCS